MSEFRISINEVEDFQMTQSLVELQQIFARAQSTVVQGGTVVLVRDNADGSTYNVDEITTEDELQTYRESVFKYL